MKCKFALPNVPFWLKWQSSIELMPPLAFDLAGSVQNHAVSWISETVGVREGCLQCQISPSWLCFVSTDWRFVPKGFLQNCHQWASRLFFGFWPYISAKDKHIYNNSFMWKLLWRPVFQVAKPNGSNQCVDNCLQKPGWSSSCTRKADVPLPGENMCAQHQMVNVDAACFCLCCFEEWLFNILYWQHLPRLVPTV